MKKINFTAFDFETATFDRFPCQLGLVVVRDGMIVEEKSYLIKPPGNSYNESCTRVHGIFPEDTESSPEFDAIWPEIRPYFHEQLIVGHSIEFDIFVLNKIISYYNLSDFEAFATRCTKQIYCNRSLEDVIDVLEIKLEKHHDALADARACAEIYMAYKNGVDPYELDFPERTNKKSFGNENQRIKSDTKIQDLSIVENKDTPFYDKKVVMSGVFDRFPIRDDLGVLLKKYGADINSTISAKTNIFIVGKGVGPSKMKKSLDLINKGANIQIVEEKQLYEILNSIN
jgi:DNA polymerase-3 subunit epsilon